MQRITRAVRDFVLPLEPSGSLDASLTFQLEEDAAALGVRLHSKIQKRLAQEHSEVQSEWAVEWTFTREDFECRVRGRIDVLISGAGSILEEIKTTFKPEGLLRALQDNPAHPFIQQVRMYAWIQAQTEGKAPKVRLRIVSLLDESETLVDVPFDMGTFAAWVEAQFQGLYAQHLRALARAAERQVTGERLRFPFDAPRSGQERMLSLVADAMSAGSRLLVQAPTGLGKTAAVLYPGLQKALADDLRVFYLTPRDSQHSVAEGFVRRLHEAGHPVRSVSLRAKERICPQEEVRFFTDLSEKGEQQRS